MIWGAVVVAAGRGVRFGRPKQLVELAGKPLLVWSIDTFASMPEVSDITVVVEAEDVELVSALLAPRVTLASLRVVAGGADRQASAHAGVLATPDHCSGIFIHDGARPLVEKYHIRGAMRTVRPGIGALLATPVIDTIKVAREDGRVERTLQRDALWAAQTPQFATARDMRRAHHDAHGPTRSAATDDAMLLERAGCEVVIVPGSAENIKITLPHDLRRAELFLRDRDPALALADDMLTVECYVDARSVDEVLRELESRAAHIDAIDRDLPSAVAIRAYATPEALRGFGRRLATIAGEDALFTTHVSRTEIVA